MIKFSITEHKTDEGMLFLRVDFTDDEGRARHLDQHIEAVASGRRTAWERLVRQITEAYGGNEEITDTWLWHDCNVRQPGEIDKEWAERTHGGMADVTECAWCPDAARAGQT